MSVSGTVTLDGQPLPNAIVTFVPKSGTGRNASGTSDASGNFKLTTLKPDDGAMPGDYKVTVTYAEGVEAPAASNMKDAMVGQQKAMMQGKKVAQKFNVPGKYGSPTTTPLEQKVPAGGAVKLDLQSK